MDKVISLSVKFESCDLFKKLVTCIDKLIKEAVFEFTETGIHLQAMDMSRVSMTSFSIPSASCESFTLSQPFSVGVNIPSLVKVLSCVSSEPMELSYKKDTLHFKFPRFKSTLKTMDMDQERFEIPQGLDYKVTLTISSNEFAKVCKDLLLFDETVRLDKKGSMLTLTADGDTSCAAFDIDTESGVGDISLEFSNQYLVQFSRGSALSSQVEIQLDDQFPMRLAYSMDGVDLVFFLAPKVK